MPAYPTASEVTPGHETFSICQIGFLLWFQSEDKPGPAVSRLLGCPPPLNGCLCLPPRYQGPESHLCSPFSSLNGVIFLNAHLQCELLSAAATAPTSSPLSLHSSYPICSGTSLPTLCPLREAVPGLPSALTKASMHTPLVAFPDQEVLGVPVCHLPLQRAP